MCRLCTGAGQVLRHKSSTKQHLWVKQQPTNAAAPAASALAAKRAGSSLREAPAGNELLSAADTAQAQAACPAAANSCEPGLPPAPSDCCTAPQRLQQPQSNGVAREAKLQNIKEASMSTSPAHLLAAAVPPRQVVLRDGQPHVQHERDEQLRRQLLCRVPRHLRTQLVSVWHC